METRQVGTWTCVVIFAKSRGVKSALVRTNHPFLSPQMRQGADLLTTLLQARDIHSSPGSPPAWRAEIRNHIGMCWTLWDDYWCPLWLNVLSASCQQCYHHSSKQVEGWGGWGCWWGLAAGCVDQRQLHTQFSLPSTSVSFGAGGRARATHCFHVGTPLPATSPEPAEPGYPETHSPMLQLKGVFSAEIHRI